MLRRAFLPPLLLLLTLASPLAAAAEEPVPTLTVSGSAEVRLAPDVVTVRLGVLAEEATAQAAQGRVNQVTTAILEGVGRLGVPEERLQTSELTLSPVYARPDPRQMEREEPRIVGYRATHVVTVRLKELDKAGPVIDAGLAAGANRLEGVVFGLNDDREARQEALRRAVREARQKASTIAAALEVRLAGVLEVDEGAVAVEPPRFAVARMAMAESAAPTPVEAGEVSVSAQVTLRYRIEGGR